MFLNDKELVLARIQSSLNEIVDILKDVPSLSINELDPKKTVLVIVDMVNGFVKFGSMRSIRIMDIIKPILKIKKICDENGVDNIAFADSHKEISPEFEAYPSHCLENSEESKIIDEILEKGIDKIINKNSTNGFIEPEFQRWLENSKKENFIVVGDCTDICVQQFATTLKAWFNMKNRQSRIIVPINAVETYDNDIHNGELTNIMAIYNMIINSIEIVKEIYV